MVDKLKIDIKSNINNGSDFSGDSTKGNNEI